MFVPAGWAAADVERELVEAPERAFVPFDGLEVVDRPDWVQLTCPLFPSGGFNEVSRARLTAENAEGVIDETIAHYADRGLMFRWSVMPGLTPFDLAARLESRGPASSEVVGMARSTAFEQAPNSRLSAVEIGLDRLEEFSAVMAEGWGAPLGALGEYNRVALADPLRRQRFFVGSVDGAPAGVASAMLFPKSIYLLGTVVLPRFRHRGLYRALVGARLSLASSLGIALATTHASADTSAPLLARGGFDEWFRCRSFHFRAGRAA